MPSSVTPSVVLSFSWERKPEVPEKNQYIVSREAGEHCLLSSDLLLTDILIFSSHKRFFLELDKMQNCLVKSSDTPFYFYALLAVQKHWTPNGSDTRTGRCNRLDHESRNRLTDQFKAS